MTLEESEVADAEAEALERERKVNALLANGLKDAGGFSEDTFSYDSFHFDNTTVANGGTSRSNGSTLTTTSFRTGTDELLPNYERPLFYRAATNVTNDTMPIWMLQEKLEEEMLEKKIDEIIAKEKAERDEDELIDNELYRQSDLKKEEAKNSKNYAEEREAQKERHRQKKAAIPSYHFQYNTGSIYDQLEDEYGEVDGDQTEEDIAAAAAFPTRIILPDDPIAIQARRAKLKREILAAKELNELHTKGR